MAWDLQETWGANEKSEDSEENTFTKWKSELFRHLGWIYFLVAYEQTTFGVTSASIIYLWCIHELEVFQQPHPWSVPPPPQREKQKCRPSSKVDWKRAYSSVTGSGLSFQKRSHPICSRLTHKKHGPMDGEKIMDAMRVLEKTKTCTPKKFNMEEDNDCFQ